MSDPTTVLVAKRDDALRDERIDQLSADRFQAEPARSVGEVRYRAGRDPDLLLLVELELRLAALRLLRAIRAGERAGGSYRPGAARDRAVGRRGRVGAGTRLRGGLRRLVRKPVRYLEPCARARVVLRRCSPGHARRYLCIGGLVIEDRTRGALRRAAGGAVAHGVGAAHPPRRQPAAWLHQARAAARRVEL
jgi:hypothetical protein